LKTPSTVPFIAALLFAVAASAQPPENEQEVFAIPRLSSPPVIDGVVDEVEWREALPVTLPYEVQPGDNIPAIVDTDCFLAYDSKAVYLGCRAYDPNPEAIRAHVTDRDEAWGDDRISILFDTYNDGTRAFAFLVNPLGVQSDIIRNDAARHDRQHDSSWDAIWDSKGRITPLGWEVELAVPFTSLRFQRTDGAQTWGFFIMRNYPRSVEREFGSMPIDRNSSCLVCQAPKIRGFEGADPGRNLELNPTLTAAQIDGEEDLDNRYRGREDGVQLGVTALWGMTPNLTLSATVNPDFSQVEADQAQLNINRQFAIFFEEKRPFFLEGADFFETFFQAVHTRTVVNPNWGAKLTGKEGRGAIGALVTEDAVTAILLPGSEGSTFVPLDTPSLNAVARYRLDLEGSSNIGALVTSRQGEGGYTNQVAGIDGLFRIGQRDSFKIQALGSQTEYPDEIVSQYDQPSGRFQDLAFTLDYSHNTRDYWVWAAYRNVGDGFRADVGFMPRVNYRRLMAAAERMWWGDSGEWYTRLFLGIDVANEEDQDGFLLYRGATAWAGFEGPLQSQVDYTTAIRTRGYAGILFDEWSHMFRVRAQPSGSFDFDLFFHYGDEIDFENVRPGTGLRVRPTVNFRLGKRFRIAASYEYENLDVAGGRLYEVGLGEMGAVYQFSTRTFVRAIVQYQNLQRDPSLYEGDVSTKDEDLFTEFLFSYKVNPRTVLFAGYTDRHQGTEMENLAQLNRAVFLKVGYAFVW